MAVYSYKAYDTTGALIGGEMEARDERVVVDKLQHLGLLPVEVREPAQAAPGAVEGLRVPSLRRIGGREVAVFTRELATLLEASFPLERSLATLAELTTNARMKRVVVDLRENLRAGQPFSDCLARYPRVFNKLYVNLVRAGEVAGFLEQAVDRLAVYLERAQELKEHIGSALIYPVILVVVGGVAVSILMTAVIPKFAQIFAEQGQALPASTQIVLAVSAGLRSYWWLIVAGVLIALVSLRASRRTERGRYRLDRLRLRMPVLGGLFQLLETSRFSRTLGTMVGNGVPLLQALRVTRDTLNNAVLARAVYEVSEGIKEGEGVSGPLRGTGVFPPLFVHMMTVGEETGNIEQMLLKVADSYDRQVQEKVKRLTALLEPAMILILGLVVGFIVLSMLTAIFSINDIPM